MTNEENEWEEHAKRSYEDINSSRSMVSLLTKSTFSSPSVALQIGSAILLDKPILIVADPTIKVSKKLTLVADFIRKIDYYESQQQLEEAVKKFLSARFFLETTIRRD